MLDLVQGRLESWQSRYLFMGGRLVLIRSVLSSIPIYHMSVNVLPVGVKKKLHGLFYRFLWGGLVVKNKMHLVNWETVTGPVNLEIWGFWISGI